MSIDSGAVIAQDPAGLAPKGPRLSCGASSAAAAQVGKLVQRGVGAQEQLLPRTRRRAASARATFRMPRKQERTEQEVHAMIVQDSKMRFGCADFAPAFALYETRDPAANWDARIESNAGEWPTDCAQAFKEAVARARRKFDIAWPL